MTDYRRVGIRRASSFTCLKGLVWTLITVCSTLASEAVAQLDYYTTTPIHSKISIPSTLRRTGGLVIHVDSRSCVSCLLNVRTVCEYAKRLGLPVTVYVNANSLMEFEELESSFNGALIVDDELRAYAKLHGVEHYPVIFVVNANGVVQYVGVPGGTRTFNVDSCSAAIQSIAAINNSNEPALNVRTILTIAPINGKKLSPFSVMKCADTATSFAVLDPREKCIFLFNGSGLVGATWDISQPFSGFTSYDPYLVAISHSSDSVLIYDSDVLTAEPLLYWLTLSSGKQSRIEFPRIGKSRATSNVAWDEGRKAVWLARRPVHNSSDTDVDPHSVLYFTSAMDPHFLGVYPTELDSLYVPNFYWTCFATTKHYTVELQSISRQLTVYNSIDSIVNRTTLDYPVRNTVDAIDRIAYITPTTGLESVKRIADSSQVLYRMVSDRESDVVFVFSRTTPNHYPEIHRERQGQIIHVSRHQLPSGECTGIWLMPEGIRPQDVYHNTIFATDFESSEQRIVGIPIPR